MKSGVTTIVIIYNLCSIKCYVKLWFKLYAYVTPFFSKYKMKNKIVYNLLHLKILHLY